MKTKEHQRSVSTKESYSFDVKDRLGREIGAAVWLYHIEYREVPEDTLSGYYDRIAPGAYYAFVPHATRNGKCYGASRQEQRHATEAGRRLAIEKYIAGAQKRAQKKAA